MTSITDPLNRTTTFGWCNCGGLATMTDASNHTTTWNRDIQGRVTSKVLHDNTATQYVYENTTSRLKSMTDAKGQVANYLYNTDNTLQQVSYANVTITTPTVSFTYDPFYNRVVTMTDGTGVTNYTYQPVTTGGTLGATQVATIDGPLTNDTISYSYDQLGRVLNRAINSVAQTMTYDSLGRVTNMTNALGTFTPTFDGVTGRLLSMAYPNGQTASFAYFGNTGDHRMQTITNAVGQTTLSQFGYTYDGEGQILNWNRGTAQPDTVTYDTAGQVTAYQRYQSTGYGYGYDTAANRTTETINGVTTTSTINSVNQITGITPQGGSTKTLTYDLNGNLTGDGTRTFEWDGANRLTAVNNGNKRSEFSYDGLSRRTRFVEKTNGKTTSDRHQIWCGGEICEDRGTGFGGQDGTTKRYFAQGVQNSGVNYFYTRDHLGSIREVTDSSGNLVTRYDYDAWGRQTKLTGTTDVDFGYAGYWMHRPSGLNLTWYRAYDANFARWLSRDPVAEIEWNVSNQNLLDSITELFDVREYSGSDLGNGSERVTNEANLYTYVLNNPVRLIDPLGLKTWYGNWCGPGPDLKPGQKPPGHIDAVDACCEVHDGCYNECTPPAAGFKGAFASRTKNCDLDMCGCLKTAKCKGFKCKIAKFLGRVIFCTLGKLK